MTKLTTRNSTNRKSTLTRLTDTQLIVLSRAAQREDSAATLPDDITEKAVQKLAAALVRRQLVREIRAKPGMPVWKCSEKGRSHALIITKLGRTAIKAENEGESEDSDPGVQASASTVASAQSERNTPRRAASSRL
jgi:CRP-like cAMP-binding protein